MVRIIIAISVIVIVFSLLISGGAVLLAWQGPLLPDEAFFGWQAWGETIVENFTPNRLEKIQFLADITTRRARDMKLMIGDEKSEVQAAASLNLALDKLFVALEDISVANRAMVLIELREVNRIILPTVEELQILPEMHPEAFRQLRTKVKTFDLLINQPQVDIQLMVRLADVQIPWEDTVYKWVRRFQKFVMGKEAAHPGMAILGQHALVECVGCHVEDMETYKGVISACESCHLKKIPQSHYAGECSACHEVITWRDVSFDHGVVFASDCLSCHITRRPENHFGSQCSICHTTRTWATEIIDHSTAGATDCLSCHIQSQPSAHFNEQCSLCHSTISWQTIDRIDHTLVNLTECASCHFESRPLGHYDVECSTCHTYTAWVPVVRFDHQAAQATDCLTCHTNTKPANHFTAVCSSCHNIDAWIPIERMDHTITETTDCLSCHTKTAPVNHFNLQCSVCHNFQAWIPLERMDHAAAGVIDCQSCHEQTRPVYHFTGQCSTCHTTNAWKPVNFRHTVDLTNCKGCHESNRPANHYSGQCSSCHNTNAWKPANFNHASQADCQSCHQRPINHFTGQCSNCHTTRAWKPASVSHAGLNDCQSCHNRPSGHLSGQCSQCHNTNNWSSGHSFPINHKKADGVCSKCHPTLTTAYSCFGCHEQKKMDDKHKEVQEYNSQCANCHPDGKASLLPPVVVAVAPFDLTDYAVFARQIFQDGY